MSKKKTTIEEITMPSSCNCLAVAQEKLAKYNTAIDTKLLTHRTTWKSRVAMYMPTHKVDAKNRKPMAVVLCEYCPFCGKKLTP